MVPLTAMIYSALSGASDKADMHWISILNTYSLILITIIASNHVWGVYKKNTKCRYTRQSAQDIPPMLPWKLPCKL